ncbi:armadillo-type protein [Fimicolochytrium jonesii]|uniref:armadillo-type protein n=1 Tax=Fimicolochytrium jonesii TaxID=1396493 RepID=UPI0022FDD1C2|nr:armadillo-type protein [Fimicolochytrium jonesii]KAI8820459.1 armadillo-type protein [Fimicolochytrium jonesii]
MSVTAVEQALEQLYSLSSTPDAKAAAQNWLQQLQKEPAAWDVAAQLLRSPSANGRFFGALTFQTKITTDWYGRAFGREGHSEDYYLQTHFPYRKSLTREQLETLRDELLRCLLDQENPPFVTRKLCVSLTLFALRDDTKIWPNFISSFCEMVDERMQRTADQDVAVQFQMILMDFLTLVPEEVLKANLDNRRKAHISQEMMDNTSLALGKVQATLVASAPSNLTDPSLFRQLKAKALRCMLSWVQYEVPMGLVAPLVQITVQALPEPDLFETAMDVLADLMLCKIDPVLKSYLKENMLLLITTGWLHQQFLKAIEGWLAQTSRICRLCVEFGDGLFTCNAKTMTRPETITFLNMMLQFTAYGGYFGADQEVSELPLEFWALLQEEVETIQDTYEDMSESSGVRFVEPDDLDVPVNLSGVLLEGVENTGLSSGSQAKRDQHAAALEAARTVFGKLVEILCQKMTFPPEAEWTEWPKDLREKFNFYRRDCSDTILLAYDVLGEGVLAYCVPRAIQQWAEVKSRVAPWQVFQPLEATLYAIRSVSDSVHDDKQQWLGRIFGADYLAQITELAATTIASSSKSFVLTRLRITTCLLIGSYSEWLKEHPDHLRLAIRYLATCVTSPAVAKAAVDGLLTICDVCRKELVEEVDPLIELWLGAGPSLSLIPKSRLVKAIGNVVQSLPSEALLPRLLVLIESIIKDIKTALEGGPQDADKGEEIVIQQLTCLRSICKGIQQPDDLVSLVVSEHDAPPAQGTSDPHQAMVASVMWDMTQGICRSFAADAEVMKVSVENMRSGCTSRELYGPKPTPCRYQELCSFINEALRNSLPIFTLNLRSLNDLIVRNYSEHLHACFLDTAAGIVTAYGGSWAAGEPVSADDWSLASLLSELCRITIAFLQQHDVVEYPDLVQSAFAMLTRFAEKCPRAFLTIDASLTQSLFGGLLLRGLSVHERFAVEPVAHFISVFVHLDSGESDVAAFVRGVVESVGANIVYELLQNIGGRQPRSMDEKFADVLYALLVKYPQPMHKWMYDCLAQGGFPSHHATAAYKESFLKNAVGGCIPRLSNSTLPTWPRLMDGTLKQSSPQAIHLVGRFLARRADKVQNGMFIFCSACGVRRWLKRVTVHRTRRSHLLPFQTWPSTRFLDIKYLRLAVLMANGSDGSESTLG